MTTERKNIFRQAMDAMVEARQRQARAYVSGALLMLDDKTLSRYGIERNNLK